MGGIFIYSFRCSLQYLIKLLKRLVIFVEADDVVAEGGVFSVYATNEQIYSTNVQVRLTARGRGGIIRER